MSHPPALDERARALHPLQRWVFAARAAAVAAVLAAVVVALDVAAASAGTGVPGPVGAAGVGVLAVGLAAALWWSSRLYRAWTYVVGDDVLELRYGVVRTVRSAIPYFRVQHIDITAGPLERALGVASLVVRTASATTDASLPGVAADEAEALRAVILARTGRGDAV